MIITTTSGGPKQDISNFGEYGYDKNKMMTICELNNPAEILMDVMERDLGACPCITDILAGDERCSPWKYRNFWDSSQQIKVQTETSDEWHTSGVDGMDRGIPFPFLKSDDDIKLCGMVDMLEKANHILDCIKRSSEVILLLYSTLMRPTWSMFPTLETLEQEGQGLVG
ncbi:hypothetical protein WISP_34557 [Willisornis vidua]|uniref:Uncharacterized protein n=1 Tax=Willisornis vidua TaxID=1566151 RepID=A0ABQ9DKD6_9PASS|nr:hypothetical protein WISP_34557 [Willisornis vidua]